MTITMKIMRMIHVCNIRDARKEGEELVTGRRKEYCSHKEVGRGDSKTTTAPTTRRMPMRSMIIMRQKYGQEKSR
jgi:hypothetical protein